MRRNLYPEFELPQIIGDRHLESNLMPFDAHLKWLDYVARDSKRWCWDEASMSCSRLSSTVAVKVISARLADLEPTIQRTPDIRLIHYVRDPRAITVSRSVSVSLTRSLAIRVPSPSRGYSARR